MWEVHIFTFMNFQEIDDFGGEIGGNLVCEEIWVWQSCQESIRHTAVPTPLTQNEKWGNTISSCVYSYPDLKKKTFLHILYLFLHVYSQVGDTPEKFVLYYQIWVKIMAEAARGGCDSPSKLPRCIFVLVSWIHSQLCKGWQITKTGAPQRWRISSAVS